MKTRSLLVMLGILVALAAFVYFYEIEGGKKRSDAEKAEKKILQVQEADIEEIALLRDEGEIRARREGTQWRIVSPIETEADQHEWNTLSRSLGELAKDKDMEIDAQDLSPFGLATPRIRVLAKTKDGAEHEILWGDENPTQTFVYAKTAARPDLMLVPTYSFRSFDKKFMDLRDKSVLKAEQSEVQEITLRNEQGTVALRRKGEDWEITAPVQAPADKTEVSSFLSSVTSGNVKELIDEPQPGLDTGLDKPAYDLTLVTGENRALKRLTVGAARPAAAPDTSASGGTGSSSETTFYARDDSRKALLVIDKVFTEKLDKKLADFRDKTIVKLDRDKLKRVEIAYGGEQIALVKKEQDWFSAADEKKQAKSETVTPMLSAVEYGRARSVLDPPFDDLQLGLAEPDVKVTFEHEDGARTELWLGKDDIDGTYARVVGENVVKVLEKDVKDKLKLKPAELWMESPAEKP